MIRLIILVAVGYIFYRALKNVLIGSGDRSGEGDDRGLMEVDDVLVQDPVCKTYIARRNSLQLRRGGEVIHFCSETCRDRYLEDHPEDHH